MAGQAEIPTDAIANSAFYERAGERFAATELTRGPWDGAAPLRLQVDREVLEVLAGDGRAAIAVAPHEGLLCTDLTLFAEGGTADLDHLRLWPLAPIW